MNQRGNWRISADPIFHILRDAVTLAPVALLNKKTRAAPLMAFVGYTLEVITLLPP